MLRVRTWLVFFGFTGLFGIGPVAADAACTLPNQLTNGQTADASQVMANFNAVTNCANNAPAGSANALQYNAGSGSFGAVGPLTNGQVLIGSTGNAPQAEQLSAGTGISIASGPGSIMISGVNSPYTSPKLANFTWGNQPSGATAADTSTGLVMVEPPQTGDNAQILWDNNAYPGSPSPSNPFVAILGFHQSAFLKAFQRAGLIIGDGSGKLIDVEIGNDNSYYYYVLNYWSSINSISSQPKVVPYYPPGGAGIFVMIKDDGTNLYFGIGNDLNNIQVVTTLSRTAFLSAGPTKIGLMEDWYDDTGFGVPLATTYFHYSRSDGES